jgi:hypothetical protein
MLYGLVGGFMGTAWTQVTGPYMIFSSIGLWIRRRTINARYGKRRMIVCNPQEGCAKWDYQLPFFRKLLKGVGCIYCTSTWFTLLIYITFPLALAFEPATYLYHFIGVVCAIGVNMTVAQIVVVLREAF